jgi:GTPase SAR1 family protein
VIVTVEGPSAAGKTTWCRQHASEMVVEEYEPKGSEPDGADLSAQVAYYLGVSSSRWRVAQELEARSGTAVCDGDPLKLHYSCCVSRTTARSLTDATTRSDRRFKTGLRTACPCAIQRRLRTGRVLPAHTCYPRSVNDGWLT